MEQSAARAGNADQITRRYYDSLLIQMRLIGSAYPSTDTELFGTRLKTPIMTAALSRLDENYTEGIVAVAEGAKAAGSAAWMGIGEDAEFGKLAATGVPAVKIIKPYADDGEVLRQIAMAKAAGAVAVGMDIDHCFSTAGGVSYLRDGAATAPKDVAQLAAYVQAAGKTPFIVKGVLSVEDAERCARAGAAALVVSHHHAIMRFATPPPMILTAIRQAVGGRVAIIADSCIQSGADAFKALALGADAVCVGRSLLDPLKREGAAGVEATLRAMTGELAGFMARTGAADVGKIDPGVLTPCWW